MAFAKGGESKEISFKLYSGVSKARIVAVNPSMDKFNELMGSSLSTPMEYRIQDENRGNGITILFIMEDADLHVKFPAYFRVYNSQPMSQSGSYEVIDIYGNSSWLPADVIESGSVPPAQNGGARLLQKGYRKAYSGEATLIDFLKNFACIPVCASYKDGSWVPNEDMSASEAALDMEVILKGDVSEIRELVEAHSGNMVKIAVGIRMKQSGNGTSYHQFVAQDCNSRLSTSNRRVIETFKAAQARGRYQGVSFFEGAVREIPENEWGGSQTTSISSVVGVDSPIASPLDDCDF